MILLTLYKHTQKTFLGSHKWKRSNKVKFLQCHFSFRSIKTYMAPFGQTQEMKRHTILRILAANHFNTKIASFLKVTRWTQGMTGDSAQNPWSNSGDTHQVHIIYYHILPTAFQEQCHHLQCNNGQALDQGNHVCSNRTVPFLTTPYNLQAFWSQHPTILSPSSPESYRLLNLGWHWAC